MPRHGTEITREQLDILRNKFDLLQGDRKAYFETYEATKKANEQLLRELREANKDLRKRLSNLQKEGRDAAVAEGTAGLGGTAAGAGAGAPSTALGKLEASLQQKRNAYDLLRSKTKERQKELQTLRDQFRDLELDSKKPTAEDSPLTRKIRQLENRLDKAMIKYNEAQSIGKTYEQIVKRLQEDRVGFDNQLVALERTVAAKEHDYSELLLLSSDAQHAKEVALAELERVKTAARQEKETRTKALREKQSLAQARAAKDVLLRTQQKQRADALQEIAGGDALKRSLAEHEQMSEKLAQEAVESRRKLELYEEAFRKIKEATGVSDVNEVIQKVVSQDQQQANLKQLTKENQAQIELLNKEIAVLKDRVDSVKYSGPSAKTGSRKMVDTVEEKLAAASQRLARGKDKYERLARILIGVKAGIDHLTEKLSSLRSGEAHPVLGTLSSIVPPSTSVAEASVDSIVDVLQKCEGTLVETLGKVEEAEATVGDVFASETHASALSASRAGLSSAGVTGYDVSERDIEATRQYNMRIDLSNEGGLSASIGAKSTMFSDDEDEPYGLDDDACETRESVKRAAKQTLSHSRKGGMGRKPGTSGAQKS